MHRRHVLRTVAGITLAGNLPLPLAQSTESAMLKGRIKQSIVFWCFNARGEKWDAEKTCTVAKELGVPALEVIGPEHWPTMKKHGLICALAPNGMPGAPFMRGFN